MEGDNGSNEVVRDSRFAVSRNEKKKSKPFNTDGLESGK